MVNLIFAPTDMCGISFPKDREKSINSEFFSGAVFCRKVKFDVALPEYGFTMPSVNADEQDVNYKKIQQWLAEFTPAGSFPWNNEYGEKVWELSLEFGIMKDGTSGRARERRGYILLSGGFLTALRELSAGEAQVKIDFTCGSEIITDVADEDVFSKQMKIDSGVNGEFCQDWHVTIPTSNDSFDWRMENMLALCKIMITMPGEVLTGNYKEEGLKTVKRKILQEGISSDVVIVAGNGAKIKAHKKYLACKSAYFANLFQQNERNSNETGGEFLVKMEDMMEESVRALLQILYCEDTHAINSNMWVLLDVLGASYKYEITSMQNTLVDMVLETSNEKFDVEAAVRLFFFAKNATQLKALIQSKATAVLRLNVLKLRDSRSYQNILKINPWAAEELYKVACAEAEVI